MNLFFDTSVLVAASVGSHPRHERALAALESVKDGKNIGYLSQHSVAEVYAALTSAPLSPRIHPSEAQRILEENLLAHLKVVALEPRDYLDVVRESAAADCRGGKIYDALHLRCAEKQPVDRLYTFNVKDFRALAADALAARICEP